LSLWGDRKVGNRGMEYLSGLTNVEKLHLTGTRVGDAGLEYLKALSKLQELDLRGTEATQAGIQRLWEALSPRCSIMSDFAEPAADQEAIVERAIRKELGLGPDAAISDEQRTSLTRLMLADESDFGDGGMSALSGLPNLQSLHLGGTRVSDVGLAYLSGLTRLFFLNLHSTDITDAGLAHLSGLVNLQTLWLYNTAVSDAGLVHLETLTNLRELSLEDTDVTNGGVRALRKKLPSCAMGS